MLKQLIDRVLFRSRRNSAVTTDGNGNPDELLPPEPLQQFVGGSYKEVGAEFFRYLVDLCDLRPRDAVLDVGCGSGRIAAPLTTYLDREGRYAGFDVSRTAIAWCKENITRRYPNFDFRVADIQNGPYNPKGKYKPSEFRFPYDDGVFNVVFLASVFTHMFPPDVEHYLHEIVRVLKPGGRCLGTFFLLNEESTSLIDARKGTYHFEHHGSGWRTIDAQRPEEGLAYPESLVRDLHRKCGLAVRDPVHYGSWCGRTQYLSFQDILVAVKPEA